LCEKSSVLTMEDAERVVRVADNAGLLLAVAHNRRLLPAKTEHRRLAQAIVASVKAGGSRIEV
jgi:predicted dehydrogenase